MCTLKLGLSGISPLLKSTKSLKYMENRSTENGFRHEDIEMLENFTPDMVLQSINLGLQMHRTVTDLDPAPSAETLFASGYVSLRIEQGIAAQKGFTEHDRRVIKAFAARLFDFESNGAALTMPLGRELRILAGMDNRALRASGNLLMAQAFAGGYNSRIKIAPGITLVGEKLLTHLEDGDKKFSLLDPLDPVAVTEAAVSLFYADLWQPKSD